MTIQPTLCGILRPGLLRTETGTEAQPENLKRIIAGNLETIRAGNTGHGLYKTSSWDHPTRIYKTSS